MDRRKFIGLTAAVPMVASFPWIYAPREGGEYTISDYWIKTDKGKILTENLRTGLYVEIGCKEDYPDIWNDPKVGRMRRGI